MPYRVAVDIGGTFTDLAVLNEKTGEIRVAKSSTTPRSPANGVLNCIEKLSLRLEEVIFFSHGTTAVTNAVRQRSLEGKVALLTTKGFRDMLEITRGLRPAEGLYNPRWEKPTVLVPRYLRFEATERVTANGKVIRPLDCTEVESAAKQLVKSKVSSLAISFLHSYVNPKNERAAREIVRKHAPGIHVSLSSEVNPQIREYERTSTTVIDAYAKPVLHDYLRQLESVLRRRGLAAQILLIRSSGGLYPSDSALANPVHLIESGPAAGVLGSAYIGNLIDKKKNLITIDMGGTTFKAGLIKNGSIAYRPETDIEWGMTVRVPMIDLEEIPAGGGSIAWLDPGGVLRVGPQSAQAEPGPACYDRGGTQPTITDAFLLLGYLNPSRLLAGELALKTELAVKAMDNFFQSTLGLTPREASRAILEIAIETMQQSVRRVSVERGYDPRDFAIIAFGGAGPIVAVQMARELGSSEVIVPPHPGIFSAIGMLVSDLRFDRVQTYLSKMEDVDVRRLNKIFSRLESELEKELRRANHRGRIELRRSAEIRYFGQHYEVTVPVPVGTLNDRDVKLMTEELHKEHDKRFGHHRLGEPAELVTVGVTAVGSSETVRINRQASRPADSPPGHRKAYSRETGSFLNFDIHSRTNLPMGSRIAGPCIIEDLDSTIILEPSCIGQVDQYGNVIIELG